MLNIFTLIVLDLISPKPQIRSIYFSDTGQVHYRVGEILWKIASLVFGNGGLRRLRRPESSIRCIRDKIRPFGVSYITITNECSLTRHLETQEEEKTFSVETDRWSVRILRADIDLESANMRVEGIRRRRRGLYFPENCQGFEAAADEMSLIQSNLTPDHQSFVGRATSLVWGAIYDGGDIFVNSHLRTNIGIERN